MKKLLFLLFIPLLISCGKNEESEITSSVIDTNAPNADKIFKETGCKPTDAENIIRCMLFTDKQDVKYLYGSKNRDGKECFWFAQFDSNGKQNWEIVNKGTLSTYASMPQIINNGNIVVGNVSYTNILPSGLYPVLIEPKNGKYKQVTVRENYIYSDILVYDDFFLCIVSQKELDLNPNALEWYAQINNDGGVMYQGECMNIPSAKSLFINESLFINMTSTKIAKESIKCSDPTFWEYPVNLPKDAKYEMELSLSGDEINAIYNVTLANGEQQIMKYKLSCTTGKEPVKVAGITLPNAQDITLGEELYLKAHIIPEDASITDLIWQSSDENIATVDSDGKIKGISKGECTITVTTVDGNYQATCNVRVKLPTEVTGVLIEPETVEILQGTTRQLIATVLPTTAINKKIYWSSSDENIVSIDQSGNITGKAIGTANITVQTEEGKYTATSVITVVDFTKYINLGFSAAVIVTNGYVTGSILSIIRNNSQEAINITKMEITDGFGNMFGSASNLLPKIIAPGESYSLGSDKFKQIYRPIFLWYFEAGGKTYCVHHQFDSSTPTSLKSNKGSIGTEYVTLKKK